MQKQLQAPSDSAAQPQQTKPKKKLEFSKKLTIVDIICWSIISLILLIIMLVQPDVATYCVSIFNVETAAYVSLRLGYTAKAGVENYKKIASTYSSLTNINEESEASG